MSDTDTNPDDGNEVNIKALREAAEQGKADRKEAEALRKENLFLRAGVDIDSKLGGMLFKTFEGDDVEALRAEWADLQPSTPPPTQEPPAQQEDPAVAAAAAAQQHREQIGTSGQPAGGQQEQTPHPIEAAYEAFSPQDGRTETRTLAMRQEDALAKVLEGAVAGDRRVMFDRQAWQRQQELYGDD